MKFGIFYEHPLPRPWERDSELRLFQDALDQVELADRLGIDYAWEVEHHFLEEYSHPASPLLLDLTQFIQGHRPHGPLTADATKPAWNGYLLTVACRCGARLSGESRHWTQTPT